MPRTPKAHACSAGCGTQVISKVYKHSAAGNAVYADWDVARSEWHSGAPSKRNGLRQTPCEARFPLTSVSETLEQKNKETIVKTTPNADLPTGGLWELIASELKPFLDGKLDGLLDADQINALIKKGIENSPAKRVVIEVPEQPPYEATDEHYQFPRLVLWLHGKDNNGNPLNINLVGPAGSGKSRATLNAAKAIGFEFETMSLSKLTGETKFSGYKLPGTGEYVETPFQRAWTYGRLFLLDELDNGNPNTLAWLNTALSGNFVTFADGQTVERHKNFRCVATSNTHGHGANELYSARQKQDGALLDRFVPLTWEYDETLERKLAGNDGWVDKVQAYRRKAAAASLRIIISPRASINGAVLLGLGESEEIVVETTILAGLSKTDRNTLTAA